MRKQKALYDDLSEDELARIRRFIERKLAIVSCFVYWKLKQPATPWKSRGYGGEGVRRKSFGFQGVAGDRQ
jgi:hypothetical protein